MSDAEPRWLVADRRTNPGGRATASLPRDGAEIEQIVHNQAHMGLSTGTRFGVYEIRGVLGAGGMGEVYRARDTRLGRDVAIKVLPARFAADGDRLRRVWSGGARGRAAGCTGGWR